MKNRMILTLIIGICCCWPLLAADPTDDTYPTPTRLFHIARSLNRNLVCYDANLTEDGQLDQKEPIKVYWLNRTDHPGKTNGLSYIQTKMAYGYKCTSASADNCTCTLSAYSARSLTVTKHQGEYVCFITIQGEKALLKSLYVQAKPKNPLSVEYIELYGLSVATGKELTERIDNK